MYDLEIDNIVENIKKNKAKRVCLQLPDGLKPKAELIQKEIMSRTGAEVLIWGGSCYGSCDLPIQVKSLGVDLLVHFSHAAWQDFGKRGYGNILMRK